MSTKDKVVLRTLFFLVIFACSAAPSAMANLDQLKAYKEAYAGEKPRCIGCHTVSVPKKGDASLHEWNEYGKKVLEIKTPPDVETYKTAGKMPEEK